MHIFRTYAGEKARLAKINYSTKLQTSIALNITNDKIFTIQIKDNEVIQTTETIKTALLCVYFQYANPISYTMEFWHSTKQSSFLVQILMKNE